MKQSEGLNNNEVMIVQQRLEEISMLKERLIAINKLSQKTKSSLKKLNEDQDEWQKARIAAAAQKRRDNLELDTVIQAAAIVGLQHQQCLIHIHKLAASISSKYADIIPPQVVNPKILPTALYMLQASHKAAASGCTTQPVSW